MTIEQFQQFVLEHPHFKSAKNLQTHLHIFELNSVRYLSYFNQPILMEVSYTDLHGDFVLIPELNLCKACCLPFPCVEIFCPSFNSKTSLFIDVYKTAVLLCKKQFKTGLPSEFHDYHPTSIKCAR